MRKLLWTIFGLWLCGLLAAARADTFQLADGTSLTGNIVTFNDNGITLRTADDNYTNVIWTKFSQDALKQLAENPKISPLVEPFIEITPAERPHKPEPKIHAVSRLSFPPKQSLFGALMSSPVGLIMLLLIYAANLYAAFEIAIFRARPVAVVMGVAAMLPVLGPIIFLSMPAPAEPVMADEAQPEAPPQSFTVPGQQQPAPETPSVSVEPGGLHIAAAGSWQAGSSAHPEPQVFQRGQFTFNRRFFETKFSGFFGMRRQGAEKDMVLLVKTPRGQHIVERITRITANDAHFEVVQGATRQEIMVPFAEIQEIQLKHKDA